MKESEIPIHCAFDTQSVPEPSSFRLHLHPSAFIPLLISVMNESGKRNGIIISPVVQPAAHSLMVRFSSIQKFAC